MAVLRPININKPVNTTILNNEEFLNLPRMDSFMRLSFGLKINKIKYSFIILKKDDAVRPPTVG